jgi:hypothetical protein
MEKMTMGKTSHKSLDAHELVECFLGGKGRMLSLSKSRYSKARPKNLVIFNSNVCIEGIGKVWHGDLDFTLEEPLLRRLAEVLDKEIYVLYEMDGRFCNEGNPKIDNAIVSIKRKTAFHCNVYVTESRSEYFQTRDKTGVLALKMPKRIKEKPRGSDLQENRSNAESDS